MNASVSSGNRKMYRLWRVDFPFLVACIRFFQFNFRKSFSTYSFSSMDQVLVLSPMLVWSLYTLDKDMAIYKINLLYSFSSVLPTNITEASTQSILFRKSATLEMIKHYAKCGLKYCVILYPILNMEKKRKKKNSLSTGPSFPVVSFAVYAAE